MAKPEIIEVKLSDIKLNHNNPRLIKDDKFKKLVNSIKEFPQMLKIRPIVVNSDMVILGGNMRYKACKEAGMKEVSIIIADNLTEEQQREFLIKDNTSGGEWDWEVLANEWDNNQLEDWGLDIPEFESYNDINYSDKNKEIDTDFSGQKYTFKLEYTEEEYSKLKSLIESKGQTPEQIFYEALTTL